MSEVGKAFCDFFHVTKYDNAYALVYDHLNNSTYIYNEDGSFLIENIKIISNAFFTETFDIIVTIDKDNNEILLRHVNDSKSMTIKTTSEFGQFVYEKCMKVYNEYQKELEKLEIQEKEQKEKLEIQYKEIETKLDKFIKIETDQ